MKSTQELKPIKNELIYLTLIIDRVISYGIASQSLTSAKFLYDSLSNKNNLAWSPELRGQYISYLNGSFSLGSVLAHSSQSSSEEEHQDFVHSDPCGLHPRHLRALGHEQHHGMTVSKFFICLAFMPIYIIIFWHERHNLLPEHRQRAFYFNFTLGALSITVTSCLSYFDSEDWL